MWVARARAIPEGDMPAYRRGSAELTLQYEVRGKGEPVVLLHGFTSTSESWFRLGWVDLLVNTGMRVVAPDARSHGRSAPVLDPEGCATEVLAADVVALLDELELSQASLFGFSMGGGVALRLAMDWPERVTHLAIAGVGDAAINSLHDPAEIAELRQAFTAPESDNRIRRNAEFAGNDLRALLPFLQQGGWPGGLRSLAPVLAPRLVVVAEGDEHMAETDELLRWLSPAEVRRFPGLSHFDVLGDATVKAEVVGFLAEGRLARR